ncbi:MAG: hypothetical protein NXI22_07600 [bacterium]|nr:hypothetical protein [bacterium]
MMTQNMTRIGIFAAALFTTVAFAGCETKYKGPSRARIVGEVTFDGVPVKEGAIQLYPVVKGEGRISGAAIVDGKYDVAEANGPTFANYKVKLFSYESSADGSDADNFQAKQLLPAKYNEQTEETLEVAESYITKNFELTSN